MKKKKTWRYYCEYCKKSGGSSFHMNEHEKHCTMNPNRKCRMCESVGNNTKVQEILNEALRLDIHLNNIGEIDNLSEAADGCPACILATLRQYCKDKDVFVPEFHFCYSDSVETFWKSHNEELMEQY